MRAFLVAALVALGLGLGVASPASAQDWRDSILGASAFREPLPGYGKPQRPTRATRTAKPTSQPRHEASGFSSSEEAPQRKGRRSQPTLASATGGETGIASYYWQPQKLATGGWFNPNAYTAAHKYLPFWTRVRVTRLDNGDSVDVTINDRGPYVAGRIIDLSRAAAQSIGMTGRGLARVRVTILR
jgi:rare lipoprotein A